MVRQHGLAGLCRIRCLGLVPDQETRSLSLSQALCQGSTTGRINGLLSAVVVVTEEEMMRPPKSHRNFAFKALGFGTVLAVSGTALTFHFAMRYMEVKNVSSGSLLLAAEE